jgi:hypothetical protein
MTAEQVQYSTCARTGKFMTYFFSSYPFFKCCVPVYNIQLVLLSYSFQIFPSLILPAPLEGPVFNLFYLLVSECKVPKPIFLEIMVHILLVHHANGAQSLTLFLTSDGSFCLLSMLLQIFSLKIAFVQIFFQMCEKI